MDHIMNFKFSTDTDLVAHILQHNYDFRTHNILHYIKSMMGRDLIIPTGIQHIHKSCATFHFNTVLDLDHNYSHTYGRSYVFIRAFSIGQMSKYNSVINIIVDYQDNDLLESITQLLNWEEKIHDTNT